MSTAKKYKDRTTIKRHRERRELDQAALLVAAAAFGAVAAVFICDALEPGCSGVMLNRSGSDLRGGPVELDRRPIDEGGPEVV